jgi:hypothetical protein
MCRNAIVHFKRGKLNGRQSEVFYLVISIDLLRFKGAVYICFCCSKWFPKEDKPEGNILGHTPS